MSWGKSGFEEWCGSVSEKGALEYALNKFTGRHLHHVLTTAIGKTKTSGNVTNFSFSWLDDQFVPPSYIGIGLKPKRGVGLSSDLRDKLRDSKIIYDVFPNSSHHSDDNEVPIIYPADYVEIPCVKTDSTSAESPLDVVGKRFSNMAIDVRVWPNTSNLIHQNLYDLIEHALDKGSTMLPYLLSVELGKSDPVNDLWDDANLEMERNFYQATAFTLSKDGDVVQIPLLYDIPHNNLTTADRVFSRFMSANLDFKNNPRE